MSCGANPVNGADSVFGILRAFGGGSGQGTAFLGWLEI